MDKQQAQQIIRNTFENSFDKSRFAGFIKDFLNGIDDAPFTYQGKYIPDAYKQYIKTLERIGKFSDGENSFDILVITLQKETSLERARTMQRNFIAWYLNGSRGGEMKEAALAAFVSPDGKDWRFSLVKMDYKFEKTKTSRMKVKEEFTPARRWSFLVGANEKSHTAQSRLVNILANDEQAPTLDKIEKSFDIETVTKEFFLKYRELFLRTKEELDRVVKKDPKIKADFEAKGVDTVNFAKKLLGQIVFLYFLQKKGWFGVGRDNDWGTGSKHFLRELFEKKHSDYKNFYNDILEPLFYEALRTGQEREHEDYYYSRFNCKIPFLNGGLFDPIGNYDWVHTDILLPDELFSNNIKTKEGDGILDIFDRFNFTVKEDEPLEKEVAIDPELLGKAYEKFNAIRPDNYDEFRKALKSGKTGEENKFNKKFGVYYTPREIVHYMCQQSLINYLVTELTDCHSRSPLSGNPVVSKEDIGTLIHTGEQVSENEVAALIKEQNIKEGKQKTSEYKLQLSENIRSNAALIDDKLANITVCDPAVGSGAFPVGMMSEIVRARNVLSVFLNDNSRTAYEFKRRCIEHSLYGVDIDPGAVEIAKLRLWLSLVVDEEDIKNIKPLPNLDYKIVRGNSLIGFPENWNSQISKEIEDLKDEFFSETNPSKKTNLKKQIDNKLNHRYENSQKSFGYKIDFDFKMVFSEVFLSGAKSASGWHRKGGFDIVIANPPYGANIDSELDTLRPVYSKVIQNYAEIYKMFFQFGMCMLNKSGILAFITPNTYLSQPRYKDLRKFMLQFNIWRIINLGEEVFEECVVPVCLTFLRNTVPEPSYLFADVSEKSKFTGNLGESRFFNIPLERVHSFKDLSLYFADELRSDQVYFDTALEIKDAGIQYHRSGIGLKKKGGNDLYERLFSDNPKAFKEVRPVWYGKLINRYYIAENTDEYFNLNYRDVLRSNESVSFTIEAFKMSPKIIWRQTAPCLQATIDEQCRWFRNTIQCAYIKPSYLDLLNIKYVLAICNSKHIAFVYNKLVKESGRVFPQVKITPVKKLPLVIASKEIQDEIVSYVSKIFSLKQKDACADISSIEEKIDKMVYKLYNITPEEIAIVEGKTDLT